MEADLANAANSEGQDVCRPTDLTLPLQETLGWSQALSLSIP